MEREQDEGQSVRHLVGQNCRLRFLLVAGTSYPVLHYFEEVLQPLLGDVLATPRIQDLGGGRYEIEYRCFSRGEDVTDISAIVRSSELEPTEVDSLKQLHQRLLDRIEGETDRSRRKILETFVLPDPEEFPNCLRRSPRQAPGIVITDWGLTRTVAVPTEIRSLARMPRRKGRSARWSVLAVVIGLAVLLMLVSLFSE